MEVDATEWDVSYEGKHFDSDANETTFSYTVRSDLFVPNSNGVIPGISLRHITVGVEKVHQKVFENNKCPAKQNTL